MSFQQLHREHSGGISAVASSQLIRAAASQACPVSGIGKRHRSLSNGSARWTDRLGVVSCRSTRPFHSRHADQREHPYSCVAREALGGGATAGCYQVRLRAGIPHAALRTSSSLRCRLQDDEGREFCRCGTHDTCAWPDVWCARNSDRSRIPGAVAFGEVGKVGQPAIGGRAAWIRSHLPVRWRSPLSVRTACRSCRPRSPTTRSAEDESE